MGVGFREGGSLYAWVLRRANCDPNLSRPMGLRIGAIMAIERSLLRLYEDMLQLMIHDTGRLELSEQKRDVVGPSSS